MFKRYWIIAVALGLIAVSLHAQEQTNTTQDRTTEQQQSADDLPLGFPVRIIEDDKAANARERREQQSDDREKDDLIAQKAMADATVAMNEATQSMKNAAWWSFGTVAIGTLLLIWTLGLTRQANKAARDAVDVTREVGQAQVRAYLAFEITFIEINPGKAPVFAVKITNVGQTPAYDVIAVGGIEMGPSGVKWEWNDNRVGRGPLIDLHPKGDFIIYNRFNSKYIMSSHDIATLRENITSIYGRTIVYFKDVFGRESNTERTERFSFEFSGIECFETQTVIISPKESRDD